MSNWVCGKRKKIRLTKGSEKVLSLDSAGPADQDPVSSRSGKERELSQVLECAHAITWFKTAELICWGNKLLYWEAINLVIREPNHKLLENKAEHTLRDPAFLSKKGVEEEWDALGAGNSFTIKD